VTTGATESVRAIDEIGARKAALTGMFLQGVVSGELWLMGDARRVHSSATTHHAQP
jgi:hypothetical protein